MARQLANEKDLARELADIRERFPVLQADQLFVAWFLRAFLTEGEQDAVNSLTGGSGDKGVDAVHVDDQARAVSIVQGKYRASGKRENRSDIVAFAQLANELTAPSKDYARFARDLSADVNAHLAKARQRVTEREYALNLYFVTLGKVGPLQVKEAARIVSAANLESSIDIIDGRRVKLMLSDYLDGVAPPVPTLDLEMEAGNGVEITGAYHRYDAHTDIESWVFSMTAGAIGDLYERASNRLFARNIRGFLGSNEINRGMAATLAKTPQYFWYFNNGITLVCDHAEQIASHGRSVLRVSNPQIINGQQTTRVLASQARTASKASVSVRVVRIPRGETYGAERFDLLVTKIVAATNWQNAIRPSDLMSNDRRQIEIDRLVRKLGYYYIRKRQTKGEARRAAGSRQFLLIKKDEFAQAVASCDLDPADVRAGKERLFEERFYGKVFPTADPTYYLTRYWLMRIVGYAARGFPQRAYAKWLVLNFLWSKLAPALTTRTAKMAFIEMCERNDRSLGHAVRAADVVSSAALAFYRQRRGKGPRAIDVSRFFARRSLPEQFGTFWKGPANRFRQSFSRVWRRFLGEVSKWKESN